MGTLSRVTAGMLLITATIVAGSMSALAVLKKNSDGKSYEVVKKVQKKVGAGRDGKFGDTTERKVEDWQRRNNVTPVDGIVGEKTWQKMFGKHKGPYLRPGTGSKSDIKDLQKKLNKQRGTGTVIVDGKFGPATVTSLNKFQKSKGIEPNDDVESDTRYMLKWVR